MHAATVYPKHQVASKQPKTFKQGPLHPTLRANPYPKVTDPICRLPLPTLFKWPEAANLGDLMRLWARPRVRINLAYGFSMATTSVPNTPKNNALCLLIRPIARQSDFRVPTNSKEKTTLSGASNCITICNYVTIQYPRPGWWILTPLPVKQQQLIINAKNKFRFG